MIAYLDTSMVMDQLFSNRPLHWYLEGRPWEAASSSSLLQVEGLRTIDNLRLQGKLEDIEVSEKVQLFQKILEKVGEIPLSDAVLHRASLHFPTIIRALDAIHVASALRWKEHMKKEIIFWTRDFQQGHAARAVGLHAEGFE